MIELIPHRARFGTTYTSSGHAVLAETHSTPASATCTSVTTLGSLSIVGDIRLWNRHRLLSLIAESSTVSGLNDRSLLLAAFARYGVGFLDDVDGDFAFVIWDAKRRRVIAVRDRFGVKPLFYERTATGIRFASEPKQLAMTSSMPVRPNPRSVVEYLDDSYAETRCSFYDGIQRVRPSMALIADPGGAGESRYWDPDPGAGSALRDEDPSHGFRDRLAEAVRVRVESSTATVAHLTGGLDSPAIAAAAHILSDRGQLTAPFHTVSAVFPGRPGDESMWIGAIAERQPFPHHDFDPPVDGIEAFDRDMWDADQPRVHRIRGMWTETAAVADAVGADLVLTGSGGDQVLDQDQLVIDRLRMGSVSDRFTDARAAFAASPLQFRHAVATGTRNAIPVGLRRAIRSVVPRRATPGNPLVRADLRESLETDSPAAGPSEFGFPSPSQNAVIANSQHASIAWFNEIQEAEYASRGLDVSHPFLDRSVVEYVASIPVAARPFDGRTKMLARRGFADHLPDIVLDRQTKTIADEYLDQLFVRHGNEYRARFPTVIPAAAQFLDSTGYAEMLGASAMNPPGYDVRESIWNAWTLMAWLDLVDAPDKV